MCRGISSQHAFTHSSAPHQNRSYATVSESAGVKVVGIDNGQATTSLSVIVKGGSRFEKQPGAAHALKSFLFKVGLGRRGTKHGHRTPSSSLYEAPWLISHHPCLVLVQSTKSGSALKTIRETELYGGVLSTGLSREHLFINAEFLRGDEYVLALRDHSAAAASWREWCANTC